jgi:hypothetical protein
MPLTLIIASLLGIKDQPQGAIEAYCVGIVGKARICAVPHYGKSGFEVSWQVIPDGTSDRAAPERATAA